MWKTSPLFPEAASTSAPGVDALYFFLVAVSAVMTVLIYAAIFWFAIKYRRRAGQGMPAPFHGLLSLEIVWSVIPLLFCFAFFGWGAVQFFKDRRPPESAIDIYVTGKQWMWKVQHPEGVREINELHVPSGRPVRLIMATEDVIHSFYIPAFRQKQDVVPGKINTMWFTATKPGKYHLFCAEYCGNQHSGMIGSVYVMDPVEYESWLTVGAAEGSMSSRGEKLFQQYGCASCHREDRQGRGPMLRNLFGQQVRLQGGGVVLADESYIRESILNPRAHIVEGFEPLMPAFQGQISEEGLLQIIAYIKSLAVEAQPGSRAGGATDMPGQGAGQGPGQGLPQGSGQGRPPARTGTER
jgi:cytochrome c oxidase subunit 2